MLKKYSTKELQKELDYRAKNPTWFIRDLVAKGYDLDTEEFSQATAWMDDPSLLRNSEGEYTGSIW